MSYEASLIVPFLDAARWLPVTAPSLLRQDVPVEIAFVDDGSTDGSGATLERLLDAHADVLEKAGHRVVTCRHDRNRGRSAARNTGVAATSAPLLAFVDADVALPPGWARKQAAAHRRTGAVAVLPRRIPLGLDPAEPYHRYLLRKEARIGRLDAARPLPWSRFVTAAVTLRRGAFEEAGGFDPAVSYGEDTELGLRVGRRHPDGFRPAPEIVAYHHDPDTLAGALRTFSRFASSDLPLLLERYPELRAEVGASGPRARLARAALGVVPPGAVRGLLPVLPGRLHTLAIRGLIFQALHVAR